MKFKKGCEPQNLFLYPDHAIKWAEAKGIKTKKSDSIEMFVVQPQCFVESQHDEIFVLWNYKVVDVSDEYPEGRMPGSSIVRPEFFSINLKLNNRQELFGFR